MTNSLLSPSTLPFGLPDYANLTDADYREAIEQGMAEHLAELDAVATDDTPATVANVLEAWERSGSLLTRAMNAFWVAKSADTNDERDAIEEDLAPRLAQHSDAILLNAALYARLTALRARRDAGEVTLDAQETHLLRERLKDFERGGIALPEDQQARLRELNTELATLATKFDQLLVAGRNAAGVHVTDEAELDGLDDGQQAAAQRGRPGGRQGRLAAHDHQHHRPARARLRSPTARPASASCAPARARPGHAPASTTPTRAPCCSPWPGCATSARCSSATRTTRRTPPRTAARAAPTPSTRSSAASAPPPTTSSAPAASSSRPTWSSIEPGATLEPWDWAYVDGRLRPRGRRARPGRPAPLPRVRPGAHRGRVRRRDARSTASPSTGARTSSATPTWPASTRCARRTAATSASSSSTPTRRPTKQGGAWMTSIVDQSHLLDDAPVVTNTCNFPPPAPRRPEPAVVGQRDHALPRVRPRPARAALRRPLPVALGHRRSPATSSSSPARSTRSGPTSPACSRATPCTTRPASRCRRSGSSSCWRTSGKETYRYAELLSAMLLDQAWHQTPADELPDRPGRRRGLRARGPRARGRRATRPCRRATARRTSTTSSAAATPRPTTPTCGRRSWTPTRSRGSASRAAWTARPASTSGARCSARAGRSTRWSPTAAFRGGDPDLAHLLRRIGAE